METDDIQKLLTEIRDSHRTVSYTHLDVYKRQGRGHLQSAVIQHRGRVIAAGAVQVVDIAVEIEAIFELA